MFFDKERQKQYEADLKEWKNNGADDKSKPKNPFEQEAKQFLADMKIKDPENLYMDSNKLVGKEQDRCLLYVFRCAVYFAEGGRVPEKLKWWNWKDKK